MCPQWRNDFAAFYAELGPCPPGHSLDRIDNRRGYEPGNCRWATAYQQSNNRGCNRAITFNGRTMNVAQWNRELGFPPSLLRKRLFRGWTAERALTTPAYPGGANAEMD